MADDGQLADWIAQNPAAAWRALDCADAHDSLHAFCGMVELPGVVLGVEPEDDEDDGAVGDLSFRAIDTPQAAHHKLLIDKLEAVERGEIPRLMVLMPPGSAKTLYTSVAFPAWVLGRRRGRSVGVATYATGLARKIGRRIRSIVRQAVYGEIMRTALSASQSAVNEWALDNGSEFMGEGILAGWTGHRLDGLIIDDPVKNREEAESPVIQEKTREEYDNSLQSRVKPGGWIVLIQTRWSEADLAGSILPEGWDGESGPIVCRDGRTWEVLCIPAEAEHGDPLGRAPGEMLWPEWFGRDPHFWDAPRRNARTWSALYQQRPSPFTGTFFKREWFRRYRPEEIERKAFTTYLTSDHAPTDGEDSDPSGCRVWGLDHLGDLYLLDGFLHRATMDVTADRIVGNFKGRERRTPIPPPMEGLIRKWRPHAWFPEDDNNWKSAAPFIKAQAREEKVFTLLEPISPHGADKAVKAQSFQGMASQGRVWLPVGPEGDAILDQYVKFPAGAHDEEVDMAAIMGRAIHMAHKAIVHPEPKADPMRGPEQATLNELMKRQYRELTRPQQD